MFPASCEIALKEWAVAVKAMGRGDQILLLRKGGIREEGRDFRVLYPEFLLYPTFEHQREDLVNEQYRQDLNEVLTQAESEESITFSHWARADEVIELTEQEKLNSLSPHSIWTPDYAQKRLHWKPKYPLSIMLIRLYRLEEPKTVPYLPDYGGCKSWVMLSKPVPLGNLTPVLTDEEFRGRVAEVKAALDIPAPALP